MSDLRDQLLELGGDLTGALEDVAVPAVLLDRDGIVRWQNKASLELRGRRIGKRFVEFVAPDDQPDASSVITRMLCHGEPAEVTLELLTAAGTYIPVQVSAVPIREGGAIVAIFGLGHVEEHKQAPRPSGLGSTLSKRQLEVLQLLAEGRSTSEIASELTLSPTTVRNHIASVLGALGVHSRLQAVVAARRAGLLDT